MELKPLPQTFTICRVPLDTNPATLPLHAEYCFFGKTDEEFSVVCPEALAPAEAIEREDGWRAFRVQGVLDLSLIGIPADITRCLAEAHVGVFAVSTFLTDYIWVKETHFTRALAVLAEAGHTIVR